MHLLLIEDNPDLAGNLIDYLEARHHIVDVAHNGLAGLEFGLGQRYDTIILDLMLPGMDGLEVCARLRAAGRTTPVLMLTARYTLQNKLEGFDSGADDYLVKPLVIGDRPRFPVPERFPCENRGLSPISLKTVVCPRSVRLVNHGADLRVVQLLVGHSSLSTAQLYTHVARERLRSLHAEHHPRG